MSRRSAAARSYRDTAPVFAALGDETRLCVVARLCSEGPLSITRLSEDAGITRQAISKHLAILAEAGIVIDKRAGRERIFQLQPARIAEAQRDLARISAQWDAVLERLRHFVEDG